jgi:hypothetical protein
MKADAFAGVSIVRNRSGLSRNERSEIGAVVWGGAQNEAMASAWVRKSWAYLVMPATLKTLVKWGDRPKA